VALYGTFYIDASFLRRDPCVGNDPYLGPGVDVGGARECCLRRGNESY
jgi:hypothetical protein